MDNFFNFLHEADFFLCEVCFAIIMSFLKPKIFGFFSPYSRFYLVLPLLSVFSWFSAITL